MFIYFCECEFRSEHEKDLWICIALHFKELDSMLPSCTRTNGFMLICR